MSMSMSHLFSLLQHVTVSFHFVVEFFGVQSCGLSLCETGALPTDPRRKRLWGSFNSATSLVYLLRQQPWQLETVIWILVTVAAHIWCWSDLCAIKPVCKCIRVCVAHGFWLQDCNVSQVFQNTCCSEQTNHMSNSLGGGWRTLQLWYILLKRKWYMKAFKQTTVPPHCPYLFK